MTPTFLKWWNICLGPLNEDLEPRDIGEPIPTALGSDPIACRDIGPSPSNKYLGIEPWPARDLLDMASGLANALLTVESGPIQSRPGITCVSDLSNSNASTADLDTVANGIVMGVGASMSMTGCSRYGKNDTIPCKGGIVATGEKKTTTTSKIKACIFWKKKKNMSHDMTKPTKWVCAQQRLRSAWASADSDQSLPVRSVGS